MTHKPDNLRDDTVQRPFPNTEPDGVLRCEDVREKLLAYMTRELSESPSALVREHIRKCEICRAEAAEIENTLALLHASSDADTNPAPHLTDEQRKRILRAAFHPIMDWIDQHHRVISIMLALVVLIATFFTLRNFEIFKRQEVGDGIPIWRMFKSGELPELVEQARDREVPPDE